MGVFLNRWPAKDILARKDVENVELFCISSCLEAIGVKVGIDGPWIAGGSVVKTILEKPLDVSDIDIFFPTMEKYSEMTSIMDNNATLVRNSKFSKTYTCPIVYDNKEITYKIQLISFVVKDKLEDILDTFDLDVSQVAFDGENFSWMESALRQVRNKEMKIRESHIHSPAFTLRRIVKYTQQGFVICQKSLDKFIETFVIRGKEKEAY